METPDFPPLHSYHTHTPMPMPQAQMSSFASPPQQHQPTPQSVEAQDRARAYKSRNKRPCDFCRYKKAACHLDSHPPCELCIRYNKECTFVESPAKRRRPNENSENGHSQSKSSSSTFGGHERNGSISNSNGASYTNGHGHGHVSTSSIDLHHQDLMGWENGIPHFPGMHHPSMHNLGGGGLGSPDFPLDPAFYQESMGFESFDPMSATSTVNPMENKLPSLAQQRSSMEDITSPHSSSSQLPANLSLPFESTSGEPSLDLQNTSNSQVVGLSGEHDPYLLARYRYDAYNEAVFQSMRIRKMNDVPGPDNRIPTFFAIQHNALASRAQPSERPENMDRYRKEVEDMVPDDLGKRLIRLFYKYIQPYYPILSRESMSRARDEDAIREPSSIATCVLAAVYGHALAFCAWDEKLCVEVYIPPSADALFRIAWLSCVPELHTPSLSTLQTLLLLVQRRPTNKHVSDTPFKGVIMTAATTVAQSLGLNRDPSDWPLPSWEIKLRRRLAWTVYIQDKWLALNSGRSTHIQASDWDVEPLTEDDFPDIDMKPDGPAAGEGGVVMSPQHFMQLASLTRIVEDVLRDLFSVKATKALHHSLEATLEVAKPLRLRLTEWYQKLQPGLFPSAHSSPHTPRPYPPSPDIERRHSPAAYLELDGNGSLQLAYITAKIELFRAMLRPRITDGNATAVGALRTGALAVAKEVCEFLEGLQGRELEAFWASYARTNFTIASSFMLLLYVTSPNVADAKECLALLNAWRSLLRIKSRSCDLLNLALLRLDGVFVAGIDRLIDLSPAAAQAWKESGQGKG